MAKNEHGQAEYEFWRWEYQRRNIGYRDAFDKLVESVNARIKAEQDPAKFIDYIESDQYNEDLVRVITSPYIPFKWSIVSTSYSAVVPSVLLEFIRTQKRLPEDYHAGFSGDELLNDKNIDVIPRQFAQSMFHIPKFHINFLPPDKFVEHIDIQIPLSVDIEILRLELSYIHAVCTTMWTNPDNSPGEIGDLDDVECDLDSPAAEPDAMARALGALRAWWRERGKKRARYAALPRAVGLWLYDYSELEGASATRTIQAFSEMYQDETGDCRIGRQFNDDHHLMKLLSTTRKCVETIEVLPIRLSPAPKVAL